MDDKEFRDRWQELKQYESFYRVQSASDVLSILSYKWSQVGGEPEAGRTIWEGVNDASHAMTKIIMEHVPSQEQDRAFSALADFINYTFVIASHERERKEAKSYTRRILDPAHKGARDRGDASRDITRSVAMEKRGINGEALTPAQILKHVQDARDEAGLDALGKDPDSKTINDDSAIRTIRRHLNGFSY